MRLEYQHPIPPPLREGGSWDREKGQDVVIGYRVRRVTDDSQMKRQVEKQVEEWTLDMVWPGPGETSSRHLHIGLKVRRGHIWSCMSGFICMWVGIKVPRWPKMG